MRRNGERAHSLIEAILASTLGTLAALLLLSILPGAMRGMAASAHELQAADLATEVLSAVEAYPFSSLPLEYFDGQLPTPPLKPGRPDQFPPAPYPSVQRRFVEGSRERVVDYQVSVGVEPGRNRGGVQTEDLALVTVRIDWQTSSASGKATPHVLEVKTLVGDQP